MQPPRPGLRDTLKVFGAWLRALPRPYLFAGGAVVLMGAAAGGFAGYTTYDHTMNNPPLSLPPPLPHHGGGVDPLVHERAPQSGLPLLSRAECHGERPADHRLRRPPPRAGGPPRRGAGGALPDLPYQRRSPLGAGGGDRRTPGARGAETDRV